MDLTAARQAAQRLYKALDAGDAATIDELLTPTFVGRTTAGLPFGLGGTYTGPAAMRDEFWWRIGKFYRLHAEPEAFEALGGAALQVTGAYRGTARATGRSVEASFIHVLGFDGERISSLTQLTDSAPWHDAVAGAGSRRLPPYPGPKVSELEAITYGVRDGVAEVTLNRPDQRNALDLRTGEEVLAVARAIAADPAVRSVLISANGPAFSVGGDIESFAAAEPGALGELAARMAGPFHEALRVLSRIDPPVVTAVHGPAVGGALGLVYAADIVLAADDAVFSTAYSGIGLSGDGGGTWHLPRLVGAARARRMYLENLRVDAATALDWGLVAEVVPAAELRDRALGLVERLAKGPTRAFGYQRRLLRETWDHSLSDQLQLEIEGIAATGGSRDAAAAISAFAGKRRPAFEGR